MLILKFVPLLPISGIHATFAYQYGDVYFISGTSLRNDHPCLSLEETVICLIIPLQESSELLYCM